MVVVVVVVVVVVLAGVSKDGRGDNSVSDHISPSLPESTSRNRLGGTSGGMVGSGIFDTTAAVTVVAPVLVL